LRSVDLRTGKRHREGVAIIYVPKKEEPGWGLGGGVGGEECLHMFTYTCIQPCWQSINRRPSRILPVQDRLANQKSQSVVIDSTAQTYANMMFNRIKKEGLSFYVSGQYICLFISKILSHLTHDVTTVLPIYI
jgi:hypothetical protein